MVLTEITIGPVRPEEHRPLGELTVRVYRQVLASDLEGYAGVLRDVDDRLAAGCEVLVARRGDQVVGGVTYVPRPGPYAQLITDDEAELRMLVVDPDAQGRGAGAALVQACVALARAAGKRNLVLGTMPAMVAAQRLYTRLGFVRTPERDEQLDSGPCLVSYVKALARPGATG
ncbi:MAG TPA: GNAT family N-acetyltransferase [Acidimicrobiales bacterium]|nr:GNAT family N-acetyltransferase [Acidimicrobiales bacterium]